MPGKPRRLPPESREFVVTTDYKSSVFLPQTAFPMRGGLPKQEPEILARWDEMDLFQRLRAASKGRPKFILHDGPPYANGNIHIGHALNKILKDVVDRTQQMLGNDRHYVPGWDCHGLPIEWKIEEEYRAKKQGQGRRCRSASSAAECRAYAEHWIDVQRAEFKRLGVDGDWGDRYATMDYAVRGGDRRRDRQVPAERRALSGSKPVMWSPVEKTALAEAEVEYHDHTSATIWVRFPVLKSKGGKLDGASVVIWTTTPWTMPGNRAIASGPDIDYALVEVAAVGEGSRAQVGEKLVLAKELRRRRRRGRRSHAPRSWRDARARTISKALVAAHPLRGQGYDFDVPLLRRRLRHHRAGTGFVHIAPGHGEDDFELGVANGVEVPDTVAEDGTYNRTCRCSPACRSTRRSARRARPTSRDRGARRGRRAAGRGTLMHSYPHSWRSKAPLIFRATPQWFIAMDKPIAEIGGTSARRRWTRSTRRTSCRAPAATASARWSRAGPTGASAASAPGACRSRCSSTRRPASRCAIPRSIARIVEAFKAEGADAWFGRRRRASSATTTTPTTTSR